MLRYPNVCFFYIAINFTIKSSSNVIISFPRTHLKQVSYINSNGKYHISWL